jgi:hypothetical protein
MPSENSKPVIYKERPVPFEVVGLTAATLIGLIALFSDVVPSSIKDTLPVPFQYGWAITLFAGSLIALIGVVFGGGRGVFFEQIGVFAAGAACLVYSAAVITWRPEVSTLMSFGMVAAYGLACMWRFGQLIRLVREAQAIADAMAAHAHQERG